MTTSAQSQTWPEEPANILMLDDDPASRLLLRDTLQPLAYNLVEATSGQEAQAKLQASPFAVVLLAVRPPGDRTQEAARLIREPALARHVPIIFIADAVCERFPPSQAYELGAVDYLTKPVVPAVLRAKVSGLAELFLDKRRAERQREQLRLLIEGTTDYAIFTLDPEGHITGWNAGAQRIKGYTADEILGKHFSIFYTADALERGWPAHELKVAGATGRFEDEGWRLRKDGSRFWANVIITALRDRDGNLIGFSKITRDLTERKRVEESLRQSEEALRRAHAELEDRVRQRTAELARANEALKEADRRKDDFVAMLAHELRNPLAPVRNALQIMKMPGLGADTVRQARDMMDRQVQHLVRLVDDLLDMSRIMRGKIELRRQPIDLSTVFARAVETAQPAIDAQGQELTVSVPAQPVRVQADIVRLAQIVSNLLVNAAKFTDKAGRIWLTATREGEEAVIRVRDTGAGIDPQMLPHIFDIFVQGDRSLARSQGGLGIGLTLVRRLAEMHGGSVSAVSAGSGQGSEFTVRLPALPALAAEEETAREDTVGAGPPRRVLVVDDNVDAAESAAMLLRFLGHDVEVAYDGHRALETAREFQPDIVLLDIGLPGLDGYDVARALRALPENKGLVLAAVTGYGQEEDRRRSREAGFDYHLTKPLAPNALTSFIASPGAAPSRTVDTESDAS